MTRIEKVIFYLFIIGVWLMSLAYITYPNYEEMGITFATLGMIDIVATVFCCVYDLLNL